MAESILKWLDKPAIADWLVENVDISTLDEIAHEGDFASMQILDLALNMSSEKYYSISKDHPGDADEVIEMLGNAIATRGSDIRPEVEIVTELANITAKFLQFPSVLEKINPDSIVTLNSKVDDFRYELLEGSSLIELLDKFIETSDLAEQELCVR